MSIEPMPQPPRVDWIGRALLCGVALLFVVLLVRGSISVACGR